MMGGDEKEGGNSYYKFLMFVLCNEQNKVKLLDVKFISVESIVEEEMLCFLDAAQEDETRENENMKEKLQNIHRLFAVPVLKYAEKKKRIYLGMDYLLHMVPVDLVFYEEKGNAKNLVLVDSVCYIQEDIRIDAMKSDVLIMGNPKYNVNENYEQQLPELPYSEMECNAIADLFETNAYTGEMAKQKVLWEGYRKKVIHISTHGGLKTEVVECIYKNVLIRSYLLLAGYEDWLYKRKNDEYGNGIISGDDFLFMDLTKTDLVVLSACVSSLGTAKIMENLHGMRWVIGAAGAKNSITTLWETKDDATAILMILLYRNLKELPVSESLFEAKKTLRMLTVEQLKCDSVLWNIAKQRIQNITDNTYKPFENWRYWAAFTCYCK